MPIYQRSQLHSEILGARPPSSSTVQTDGAFEETSEWAAFSSALDANQGKIAAGLEGLLGSVPMLELEVSRGRLSAKDLRGLSEKLRETAQRSVGLGAFYRTFERQRKVSGRLESELPGHPIGLTEFTFVSGAPLGTPHARKLDLTPTKLKNLGTTLFVWSK